VLCYVLFCLRHTEAHYIKNCLKFIVSSTNAVLICIPGDQEGLFKLAVQLRKFFNSVIYNTATGYVLLVYLTNI
jgi:hypothetical protein